MNKHLFIPKALLICLILSVLSTRSYALETDPVEKLVVIHDRELYLEGDTIWLKIINTERVNGRLLDLSSTVYSELLAEGEQLLARTKIRLHGASGSGWIVIPRGLSSGNYYLRAYTSWMKNSGPSDFAYSLVSIINPFQPYFQSGDSVTRITKTMESYTEVRTAEKLRITFNGFDEGNVLFPPGEQVRIPVMARDIEGVALQCNLAVSVSLCDSSVQDGELRILEPPSEEEYSTEYHYPELNGPSVSGVVRRSGKPGGGILITCTTLGSASQFQVFRTREDGRFRFVPQVFSSASDLVLSTRSVESPLNIVIDDPYCDQFQPMDLPVLTLSENNRRYLEQLSVNKQVMALYQNGPGKIHKEDQPSADAFYGAPSETVELENYVQLPLMEEVVRELVKKAVVYRNDGRLLIGIIDAETKEIIGENPLFLLDGIPHYSHDEIFGLDPSLVHLIHVVDSRYFLGDLEFDGIIDIRSVAGHHEDFSDPSSMVRYRFTTYSKPPGFESLEEEKGQFKNELNHLPDFRTVVYWNPELNTGVDGEAEISFTTPDVPGVYNVDLDGISLNGFRGKAHMEIVVE